MSEIERLFGLHGRTALVSGASRGIGFALACGLRRAGASVYGIGRSTEPQEKPNFTYLACDMSDTRRFGDVCARIIAETGRLDVYVHAAGITLPEHATTQPQTSFEQTITANLISAHHCCSTVATHMERGGGSIINVTSIGSELGFPGNPGYVASKGGLRALTKALAVDFGAKRIRVNSLAPGYIRTAMTERSFADPVKHDERLSRMIIKRWGTPDDLVGAALFLASDASAYITGADLYVDGGWTAKGL
jgi:NAD(P)-dependent dehydrogenase (short-subunit alcohol dehydrogenase family)